MSTGNYICETEKIFAFIDGDLEATASQELEEHITHCDRCASELQAQRLFMCELDSAFANPFELSVPTNFARVVAVRAESDMSGVRERAEHKKALRFCVILGLTAFALLGVTSSKAVLLGVQSGAGKVVGILELLGKTAYDAAVGLTVISRVLSSGLIAESRLGSFTTLFLVALAVVLLSLLISRYHRTRLTE